MVSVALMSVLLVQLVRRLAAQESVPGLASVGSVPYIVVLFEQLVRRFQHDKLPGLVSEISGVVIVSLHFKRWKQFSVPGSVPVVWLAEFVQLVRRVKQFSVPGSEAK
jgi:hypothetical protein